MDAGWERDAENFELWDRFLWILAQWLCQSRGSKLPPEAGHLRNPAVDNDPCEPCCFDVYDLFDPDLCDAIGVVGSMARRLGSDGIPERDAAAGALQAMVDYLVRKA